jgi:hypothetical protein
VHTSCAESATVLSFILSRPSITSWNKIYVRAANMKISNDTPELYFHWHIINTKFYISSSHYMNMSWEKLHEEFKELWKWNLLT